MVQVHTDDGVWLVPPQLAAWIPAGVRHRVEVMTETELWMVHWDQAAIRAWGGRTSLDRAFALRVTRLLRSLLEEAITLDPVSEKAELVVRLMLHELTAMPDAPTFLPLPTSPIGRRVAALVIGDRRNEMGLDEIASRAATSVRTVSRLFPTETGLTLKAWRQRARVVRTMERLARGEPPARVAREAGFASTAAFSSAFRKVTASTPTAFLRPTTARSHLDSPNLRRREHRQDDGARGRMDGAVQPADDADAWNGSGGGRRFKGSSAGRRRPSP